MTPLKKNETKKGIKKIEVRSSVRRTIFVMPGF